MPPGVQQMVVSNLGDRKRKKAPLIFSKTVLFCAAVLVLCLILWLISNADGFLVGMGISGVILFITGMLNREDIRPDNQFICYNDPHQIVHIEYRNPRQDPFKPIIRLQFSANDLIAYTLHSFFRGKPAMMHIHVKGRQRSYVLGPVPVEYLDAVQQKSLFDFLDALTVKTRRLNA